MLPIIFALEIEPSSVFFFLRYYLLIYLFMRVTEKEAETQAEGEAASPWVARYRAGSWDQGTKALSQRQMLNRRATQVSLSGYFHLYFVWFGGTSPS